MLATSCVGVVPSAMGLDSWLTQSRHGPEQSGRGPERWKARADLLFTLAGRCQQGHPRPTVPPRHPFCRKGAERVTRASLMNSSTVG